MKSVRAKEMIKDILMDCTSYSLFVTILYLYCMMAHMS